MTNRVNYRNRSTNRVETNYYMQPQKPYSVEREPKAVLIRLLIAMVICITLLTGATIKSDFDILSDIYPEAKALPELAAEEQTENVWKKNLVPPIDNVIYMAWDLDPLSLESIPAGVNVLAPTWFYAEPDPLTDKPIVKNLLQMGKTAWNPQQYVELCHANGVKVWGTFVCIGQPNLAREISTDMESQKKIIDQLVEWTIAYNLDGISLDFEKMHPEYTAEFNQFAKNLKDALPANQNIVSAAVTVKLLGDTSGNLWQSYDRGGLAEVIDYVAVMTYEGGYNTLVPRASIDWVETHVQRLLEEMPSNKLILGIPFYGVDYIGKVTDSDSFNVDPLWKEDGDYIKNFYSSYVDDALANGSYERSGKITYVEYWLDKGSWNDEFGISQYSFVDTEGYLHTVYVDDQSSLYQKSALLKRYNLGGVGIWKLKFGSDEMWAALADGLS